MEESISSSCEYPRGFFLPPIASVKSHSFCPRFTLPVLCFPMPCCISWKVRSPNQVLPETVQHWWSILSLYRMCICSWKFVCLSLWLCMCPGILLREKSFPAIFQFHARIFFFSFPIVCRFPCICIETRTIYFFFSRIKKPLCLSWHKVRYSALHPRFSQHVLFYEWHGKLYAVSSPLVRSTSSSNTVYICIANRITIPERFDPSRNRIRIYFARESCEPIPYALSFILLPFFSPFSSPYSWMSYIYFFNSY